MERGEGRNLANTVSARWSGSTSAAICHVDSMYLPTGKDQKGTNPNLIMTKTSDKGTLRNIPENTWQMLLKTRKEGETLTDQRSLGTCPSWVWDSLWAQCRPPSPSYPSNRLLQSTYLLLNWTLTFAGPSTSHIPNTQQEEKATEERTANNPHWCFTGCFAHIFIQETIINT